MQRHNAALERLENRRRCADKDGNWRPQWRLGAEPISKAAHQRLEAALQPQMSLRVVHKRVVANDEYRESSRRRRAHKVAKGRLDHTGVSKRVRQENAPPQWLRVVDPVAQRLDGPQCRSRPTEVSYKNVRLTGPVDQEQIWSARACDQVGRQRGQR